MAPVVSFAQYLSRSLQHSASIGQVYLASGQTNPSFHGGPGHPWPLWLRKLILELKILPSSLLEDYHYGCQPDGLGRNPGNAADDDAGNLVFGQVPRSTSWNLLQFCFLQH